MLKQIPPVCKLCMRDNTCCLFMLSYSRLTYTSTSLSIKRGDFLTCFTNTARPLTDEQGTRSLVLAPCSLTSVAQIWPSASLGLTETPICTRFRPVTITLIDAHDHVDIVTMSSSANGRLFIHMLWITKLANIS